MSSETPTPHSGPEQRRAPRLSRRFVLRAAKLGEEPLRWSMVTIHNLSASGLYFTFDRNVHEGMLLLFRIDFPERVVECKGRVVRASNVQLNRLCDVAAQFEDIKPDDQAYIEKFVLANLPKPVNESRESVRINRRFILRAAPAGTEPLVWSVVTIQDLSETGIYFTFDKYTHEGMLIHLRIDFPERLVECMGRVVRNEGDQGAQLQDIAVQFENLKTDDAKYIQYFIQKFLSDK